mgnify:CR=1 FL=1
MIKRIELYRLLKELERLYIRVRSDPEKEGLTREIIPYNYRLSLKIIRQGNPVPYFRLGMGICPPFLSRIRFQPCGLLSANSGLCQHRCGRLYRGAGFPKGTHHWQRRCSICPAFCWGNM